MYSPRYIFLLAVLYVQQIFASKCWILSDLSHRDSGDTDKDDITCIALIVGYIENGGVDLDIVGATYHASPLVPKDADDDPIINYIKGRGTFPIYEAYTRGEHFNGPLCNRAIATPGSSVNLLLNEIKSSSSANPLYVLNWGPMTELACAIDNLPDMFHDNVVILSHWTTPDTRATHNCNQDVDACYHMHFDRPHGVKFLEFGDSGQDKLVENCMENNSRYDTYMDIVRKYNTHTVKSLGKDISDMVTGITLAEFGSDICNHFRCDGTDQAPYVKAMTCEMADRFFDVESNSPAYVPMRNNFLGSAPNPPPRALGDFFRMSEPAPKTGRRWVQPVSKSQPRAYIKEQRQKYREQMQDESDRFNIPFDDLFQPANDSNDNTFSVNLRW